MVNLLDSLNDKQREVVSSTAQCVVVLAGPGSGKTRALTCRIAYLVWERGVPPWQILAVTFTNKAAGEMRERLVMLLTPKQAEKVVARTFHSFGARMLRPEMKRLAPLLSKKLFTVQDKQVFRLPKNCLSDRFLIYDDGDQRAILTRVIKEEFDPETGKSEAKIFMADALAKDAAGALAQALEHVRNYPPPKGKIWDIEADICVENDVLRDKLRESEVDLH